MCLSCFSVGKEKLDGDGSFGLCEVICSRGSRDTAEAAAEVVKGVNQPTGADPQRFHLIFDDGFTAFRQLQFFF